MLGLDVAVATPPGYQPDPAVVTLARALAAAHGGAVTLTGDPYAAVAGASAVYTDVWVSMGDDPGERAQRVAAFTPYRVDAQLMAQARSDAVFLHCLPAHRGDEVMAEVMDGPQSLVFAQAANRLPTAQAALAALLLGKLTGRCGR